jgi:hypothetical protein
VLAGEVEAGPAGGEDGQVRAGRQQVRHERRRGQEVLEVVEDQEQPPVPDGRGQGLDRRPIRPLDRAQGVEECGRDEGGIADRGERDEPDAVGEGRSRLLRHGERQAGLAHPTGAGQRHQAHAVLPQEGGDRGHFARPTHEAGERGGQGRPNPVPVCGRIG